MFTKAYSLFSIVAWSYSAYVAANAIGRGMYRLTHKAQTTAHR